MMHDFYDKTDEAPKVRLLVMVAVIFLFAVILLKRLFALQIIEGEEYLENYQMSIEKTNEISAARGNIYDKNGVLLAYNDLAYTVNIEDVFDTKAELNEEIYKLIKLIEKNGDSIVQDFNIILDDSGNYAFDVTGTTLLRFKADIYGETYITDLTYEQEMATADEMMEYLTGSTRYSIGAYEYDEDGEYVKDESGKAIFNNYEGYTKTEALQLVTIRYAIGLTSYQKRLGATVAENVSQETVAAIMENSDMLDGVSVDETTIRKYVDSVYFSQIIGYTGKISSTELETFNQALADLGEEQTYTTSDVVGKIGIEQYMELELQGEKGNELVYVDVVGSVIDTAEREEPVVGNDVYLTIDAELQKEIYDMIEQQIAEILVGRIQNIKTYTMAADESSTDIIIPIYDVYFALFDNKVISISHMNSDEAGEIEQEVFDAYQAYEEDRRTYLMQEFTQGFTAYTDLTQEYKAYQSQIVSELKSYGVLDMDLVDTSDSVYIDWYSKEVISIGEFLQYAIAMNWINVSHLNVDSEYIDSDEVYTKLIEYIFDMIDTSSDFEKLYFQYMILNDTITGTQIGKVLCEQEVFALDAEVVDEFYNGQISTYQFFINRIEQLDITPAQLALDPYAGSVVLTDVDTGDVIALVSYPSYDNNMMANTVDADYYNMIREDQSNPLFNYATQQRSAPGSTFKMVSATAALEEAIIDTSTRITCLGIFTRFDNETSKCWIWPSAHGSLNAMEAIQNSCNFFFYETAYLLSLNEDGIYDDKLGLSIYYEYADMYGLSEKSGVEIAEYEPNVSDEYPVLSAIGQGTNSYTTVGLARYVTAVANSGTTFNLTLLDCLKSSDGTLIEDYEAEVRNTIDIADSTWDVLHEGMRAAASSVSYFNDLTVTVAGKTGTAQENVKRADHALFVGYAPYEEPEIAISARIAFGYTSSNARELAYNVLALYYGTTLDEDATFEDETE
ncbi:MAG: penicillin-binding transpeptidase domain-containing protein [Lachnospiraceae bacterium]